MAALRILSSASEIDCAIDRTSVSYSLGTTRTPSSLPKTISPWRTWTSPSEIRHVHPFQLHPIFTRTHELSPAENRIAEVDASRDIAAGAVNNRSREAAFVCNRRQYISPNRAVDTTSVVHHYYIARWNIIDVIPDCSFVHSTGYIFQGERPARRLTTRSDGLNAQALPVNSQAIQGIRHQRD